MRSDLPSPTPDGDVATVLGKINLMEGIGGGVSKHAEVKASALCARLAGWHLGRRVIALLPAAVVCLVPVGLPGWGRV